MHASHFQAHQIEAGRLQSEALARIEAEQARQAEVLARIAAHLDAPAPDRPKRSTSKP